MSYWFKGIVLILVLELFIPSTKFKISGYFKEFICMKNTGESRSTCKKENKGLIEQKTLEQKIRIKDGLFDIYEKEKNNKK